MNSAMKHAIRLMGEAEKQMRKNLREEGKSRQDLKIRARIFIKQDKTGRTVVGGAVATNIPTEPVAGSADSVWETAHVTGVVGYVEIEKDIYMEET